MSTEIRTRQTDEENLAPVSEANPLRTKDVSEGESIETSVQTADIALTTQPAWVYWITISNTHATAGADVELNDSDDDGGTDRWAAHVSAIDTSEMPLHAVFDPPIRFNSGIWLDITNGTVQVTVGFINR